MIPGRLLVVDDNRLNRLMLAQHLRQQGHAVSLAEDGREALSLLREQPFDLLLLDIMMPVMDGYAVLEELHADPALRNLPVIVISALDEMDSVVRCIGMGAADYLTKPFDPVLLRARIGACLENKRLRDWELEYLEQVGYVVDAAQAVEAGDFEPASLDPVAGRPDALGGLARVFQRMAREVYAREQRLRRQLEQLRLDMEEMRQARQRPLASYLPADRQRALATGTQLPGRAMGAALFADISGFTPLAARLAEELGRQRGAEELTRTINQAYTALVDEVHRFGGSVVGFAGDAMTCWFDEDGVPGAAGSGERRGASHRAVRCAVAMQAAMHLYDAVTTPAGTTFALAVKAAVAAGPVRRLLVGDPDVHVIEAIAGETLDRLAAAEHVAGRGEVVVDAGIAGDLCPGLEVAEWRVDDRGRRVAVVSGSAEGDGSQPAPPSRQDLPASVCRPWVLPSVYERFISGNQQFLSELRPVVALFLSFAGIDYDGDEEAPAKLDSYVRWVQRVADDHEAVLTHLSMGDKGSYLCLAFGGGAAQGAGTVQGGGDGIRAVRTGFRLSSPPAHLGYIQPTRIGIAAGEALVGTYGGAGRITFGIQGESVNLAARLMGVAPAGGVLCDEEVFRAVRGVTAFTPWPPVQVKGFAEPVAVFQPVGGEPVSERAEGVMTDAPSPGTRARDQLDRLSPSEQLLVKVAAVLGTAFDSDRLAAILPDTPDRAEIDPVLASLAERRLLEPGDAAGRYLFADEALRTAAYSSMLFAQRRHLHRRAAESCEAAWAGDLAPHREFLAQQWLQAGEPGKAVDLLERAAEDARTRGDLVEAERLLRESLALHAEVDVLGAGYYRSDTRPAAGADGSGGSDDPDFAGAVGYAIGRLEQELAPELTYHDAAHTRDDVLPAARRLAAALGVAGTDAALIEVAAAFHDLGFVQSSVEHERIGAELAAQVLPGFGLTSEQVAAVQGMILATRLPQSPRSPLEEIVADADLDNLGRADGPVRTQCLRDELAAQGTVFSDAEWYRRQVKFFGEHRYFTPAARESRDEGKRANLEVLVTCAAAARDA